MQRLFIAAALLGLAIPAYAADLKTDIAAANQKWLAAYNKGDAAALTALYTDKATVLPPGTDLVTGHAAIQAFWDGAIKSGLKVKSLDIVSVQRMGEGAREIGRVKAEAPGPDKQMVAVEGKYVVVWRQVKGAWKLEADIWNLNK